MSQHKVEIVRVTELREHGNADRLQIVPIWGYETIVAKGQWSVGDLGAYIEPDYVVPTDRPEFAFLARAGRERHRVRAAKLRGVVSQGLLIPAPAGAVEGDDVMALLGVQRYEPSMRLPRGGDWSTTAHGRPGSPGVVSEYYDIENWHRFPGAIGPERIVEIREKIHGANFRAVAIQRWDAEQPDVWIGSRRHWVHDDGENVWSLAWRGSESLRRLVLDHPGVVWYGEVYGPVQDLRYGRTTTDVLLFDVLDFGQWNHGLLAHAAGISGLLPPLVYRGPMPDRAALLAMAEGPSLVLGADHIREGVVVRTVDDGPRIQLKVVGNGYLMR